MYQEVYSELCGLRCNTVLFIRFSRIRIRRGTFAAANHLVLHRLDDGRVLLPCRVKVEGVAVGVGHKLDRLLLDGPPQPLQGPRS